MDKEVLAALRGSMTDGEWEFLASVLVALRAPIESERQAESDIVTRRFEATFGKRLKLFHALNSPEECMTKKAFEFAFKATMEAGGAHSVTLQSNPTFPGADAIVDGKVGFSLKTEAERAMSVDRIKVSKLMESIWTKEATSIPQFLAGLHHVLDHLKGYQRILTLRVFGRLATGTITYELWEIPKDLLELIAHATLADFRSVTKKKGTTLRVRKNGRPALDVVFDGSDQKITLRNLKTEFCRFHGRWTLTSG